MKRAWVCDKCLIEGKFNEAFRCVGYTGKGRIELCPEHYAQHKKVKLFATPEEMYDILVKAESAFNQRLRNNKEG